MISWGKLLVCMVVVCWICAWSFEVNWY